MEWIVEAETIEDLVDGPMMISKKIVRCKDCAIAQHDELFGRWYCNGREVKPGDYCSRGERETDES